MDLRTGDNKGSLKPAAAGNFSFAFSSGLTASTGGDMYMDPTTGQPKTHCDRLNNIIAEYFKELSAEEIAETIDYVLENVTEVSFMRFSTK